MVNSVTSGAAAASAISTLLRAQSTAVSGLKVGQQASQVIINQLQSNLDASKVASAPQAVAGSLPRGSLVDVTV